MTIFQKILDGEIPCHRVYEDDHVLAFLDVSPLSRGHVLVIPKEARATLGELSDRSAARRSGGCFPDSAGRSAPPRAPPTTTFFRTMGPPPIKRSCTCTSTSFLG